MDWQVAPGSPSAYIVKRVMRLDIPVDNYPHVSNSTSISYYCAPFKYESYHSFLDAFLVNISSILLGGF